MWVSNCRHIREPKKTHTLSFTESERIDEEKKRRRRGKKGENPFSCFLTGWLFFSRFVRFLCAFFSTHLCIAWFFIRGILGREKKLLVGIFFLLKRRITNSLQIYTPHTPLRCFDVAHNYHVCVCALLIYL